MLIQKIAKKLYLTSLNFFTQTTSYKSIDPSHKREYFFLDNSREYNFPGFKTKKPIRIFRHESVNKGGPTAGIAYNKDRLIYFAFSITREKKIVEQKTDSIEKLNKEKNYKETKYNKELFEDKLSWRGFSFIYWKIDYTKKSTKIKIHDKSYPQVSALKQM